MKTFFGNINFMKLNEFRLILKSLVLSFLATIYPIESRLKKKTHIITTEVDTNVNLKN